jgi:hypothetical protein
LQRPGGCRGRTSHCRSTSPKRRISSSPQLLTPPSHPLPPLEFCHGVMPSFVEKSCPGRQARGALAAERAAFVEGGAPLTPLAPPRPAAGVAIGKHRCLCKRQVRATADGAISFWAKNHLCRRHSGVESENLPAKVNEGPGRPAFRTAARRLRESDRGEQATGRPLPTCCSEPSTP